MMVVDQNSKVTLGKLGRAKGLKGDLYFDSYNDNSEYLKSGVEVFLEGQEKPRRIEAFAPQSKRHVLHLESFESREEAEGVVGKELWVPRGWLPELREGQYYISDLVGSAVFDEAGKSLGKLKEVQDAPGNQIYVVENESGEEKWIPILEGVLQDVDLENRRIRLNPMEEIDAF